MQLLRKTLLFSFILIVCQIGLSPDADCGRRGKKAGDAGKSRRIVMFHENVTADERMDFVDEWSSEGVKLVRDLPAINGMVLKVPNRISNQDLKSDYRVVSVQKNQKFKLKKARKKARRLERKARRLAKRQLRKARRQQSNDLQTIQESTVQTDVENQNLYASADGGSADGGSADGGSADGGSADGGSADGGSADGGSLSHLFTPVEALDDDERPWGILDLYEQPFDPESLTWEFDEEQLPPLTKEALLYSHKVRVAILDTGINYTHPDLAKSIAGGVDLVNFVDTVPMDYHGHGTHVAGIIVSRFTGGVPSKAALYGVKILNDDSTGDVATLLMGLQWAIDNRIDVLSMSVSYAEDNPSVRLAVQKAHQAGIFMIAAAGNHSNWEDDGTSADGGSADGGSADGGSADGGSADGGSADGGSADGGSADGGSVADGIGVTVFPVMYPAAYPEVIAVGAMNEWEAEASFSNTGPELDVLAPGVDVISTFGDGYGYCSGTSMAAPHVTASVILMKSMALKYRKAMLPQDAKYILSMTAVNGTLNLEVALQEVKYSLPSLQSDVIYITPVDYTQPVVYAYDD